VENKGPFFRAYPLLFLPKRPKKGPFFLSVRFYEGGNGWLGVDGE
jgi:hypothetical protein